MPKTRIYVLLFGLTLLAGCAGSTDSVQKVEAQPGKADAVKTNPALSNVPEAARGGAMGGGPNTAAPNSPAPETH